MKEHPMFRINRTKIAFTLCLLLICPVISLMAQQTATADGVVPSVMKFAGTLSGADGKPLTGTQGVTFLLYKEETGGPPLWIETQNVQADKSGRYSVMLGSATSNGLPAAAFSAGEARWLGVQPSGEAEQPRTVLVSVPYALKALDAETLGGRPASAFMIAPAAGSSAQAAKVAPAAELANELVCSSGTACKAGFVPLFATNGGSAKVTDSIVTQSGTTVKVNGSASVISKASAPALVGQSSGTNAVSDGVDGISSSGTASGVAGINKGNGVGVYGTGGTGVLGTGGTGVYGFGNSGYGIYGLSNSSHGIVGISNGNFFGVVGEGGGAGVYGSGGSGVVGYGTSGVGMYGQHVGASILGSEIPYAGIWGDTNTLGAAGVAGTGMDGIGGIFLNDSPSGNWALVAANYSRSGPIFTAENMANGVSCTINASAQLHCDGGVGAIVQLDSGNRKVAMSGIQSPENWFEDFGSAQLVNGVAVIQLDRDFIQTVSTEKDYRVFPVPNGDCKGLYVTNKSTNSFEVRELGGGSSNIRFDYRIAAIRKNYETVRFADHTKDLDPRKMLDRMRKAKPVSTSDPVSGKPASVPIAGVPAPQLSNR
jgi:hypothetical protein